MLGNLLLFFFRSVFLRSCNSPLPLHSTPSPQPSLCLKVLRGNKSVGHGAAGGGGGGGGKIRLEGKKELVEANLVSNR